MLPGGNRSTLTNNDQWLEPGLAGQVQQNANKLLAAIGHNQWIPKLPGQRGIRVLSLDGGGTRGIAAVTSLRHLVAAMKGVEVCDAFDMIVGTSTGAIVSFLVGLRRESAADARIRYDTLIKRIFVKSLLQPIMLATTTASYDESNLMEVLEDILHDEGMLDSRANPGKFSFEFNFSSSHIDSDVSNRVVSFVSHATHSRGLFQNELDSDSTVSTPKLQLRWR
jgi:hypothetical protein